MRRAGRGLYFIASGYRSMRYRDGGVVFLSGQCVQGTVHAGAGIIDAASLGFSAGLMLYAVGGAVLAPLLVRYIPQKVFDGLIWLFVIVGGLKLIF